MLNYNTSAVGHSRSWLFVISLVNCRLLSSIDGDVNSSGGNVYWSGFPAVLLLSPNVPFD